MEGYSEPTRFCLVKTFVREVGDRTELYGNGIPVVERGGHIVAILGKNGFERPAMICEIKKPRKKAK